jgi:hypothetical protein
MARFEPGTDTALGGKPENLRLDVADDILDLQVAMAIDGKGPGADSDDDGRFADDNSEWWNAGYTKQSDPEPDNKLSSSEDLFYLRVNVLGRTAGRDFKYVSPPIARIENHDYKPGGGTGGEPAQPADNAEAVARSYHRRLLTTLIDMRNL